MIFAVMGGLFSTFMVIGWRRKRKERAEARRKKEERKGH
jgi:hypothetical protein